MSVQPEILRGAGRSKQRAKFRFTITHRGRFKQESELGLFSETLERSSSRHGMSIVNTAVRRPAEEDLSPQSALCLQAGGRLTEGPLHHLQLIERLTFTSSSCRRQTLFRRSLRL